MTSGPECYRSPSGDTLLGRCNVLNYMKEKNLTLEAISAMKKMFRREDVKNSIAEKRIGTRSKTSAFLKPEDETKNKIPESKEKGRTKSLIGWSTFEDKSLLGWKYKSDKSGKSGQCQYLSPNGEYLKGRLQVMNFMKKKKVGGDTISAMRDTFRTAT